MTKRTNACEGPRRRGEGFALVAVLLALMVLSGLATAAILAAVGQLRAAATAGRVMAGRAAVRGGIERVLAETRDWPAASVGDSAVELLAGTLGPSVSWRVHDLRIAREFHVLVAVAALGGTLRVRDARTVWWLEPQSRIATHRAVVEGASVVVGTNARVLADSLLAGRSGVPACDSFPLLAAALGGAVVPSVGGLPHPPDWGAGGDGADFAGLRLGWLGRSALAALADHHLSGGGVLAPGCPGCWAGLVFGAGGVRWTGSGAGVLAVDGDLVLASGSSWTGLLIVSGNVTLEPASTVLGLVRSGGVTTLAGTSAVDGSACAAFEALNAASSLARPIPTPARSWLGPLPPGTD